MDDGLRTAIYAAASELDEPTAAHVLCAAYGRARIAWALDQPEGDWLPLVLGMALAPLTVLRLCCVVTGEPLPDLDPSQILRAAGMSARTFAELEQAERDARAAARLRWRRTEEVFRLGRVEMLRATHGNNWQRRRRLLRTCPETRIAFGLSLNGREVGGAVKGLTCPICGKRSAWFWIAPQRAHRARCNRASCGWSAPLIDLDGAA